MQGLRAREAEHTLTLSISAKTSTQAVHQAQKNEGSFHFLRYLESGSDLLSRPVTRQVPSALRGLTAVFGMGTGGTLSSLPPENVNLFVSLRLDNCTPSDFES